MLLTIQSRLNTLIEYEIDINDLDEFNKALQKHREIIIEQMKGRFPSISVSQ